MIATNQKENDKRKSPYTLTGRSMMKTHMKVQQLQGLYLLQTYNQDLHIASNRGHQNVAASDSSMPQAIEVHLIIVHGRHILLVFQSGHSY